MTELKIRDTNIECHLDIEKYIQERKNGLITFTLRVNSGNIVDFVPTEYVPVKEKYFSNGQGEFKISICQTSMKP